jgi:NADPH-dependent 2,4-dienoyl-CoA reductase/sulfur reductase-like enzyme
MLSLQRVVTLTNKDEECYGATEERWWCKGGVAMTTDQSRLPDRIDVLVVGGGMAGLAAAFITDRRAAASALAALASKPQGTARTETTP